MISNTCTSNQLHCLIVQRNLRGIGHETNDHDDQHQLDLCELRVTYTGETHISVFEIIGRRDTRARNLNLFTRSSKDGEVVVSPVRIRSYTYPEESTALPEER